MTNKAENNKISSVKDSNIDFYVSELIMSHAVDFHTVSQMGLFPDGYLINSKIIKSIIDLDNSVPPVILLLDDKDTAKKKKKSSQILIIGYEISKRVIDITMYSFIIAEIYHNFMDNFNFPPEINFVLIYGPQVKYFKPVEVSTPNYHLSPNLLFLSQVNSSKIFASMDNKLKHGEKPSLMDSLSLASACGIKTFNFDVYKKCRSYIFNKQLYDDHDTIKALVRLIRQMYSDEMTSEQHDYIFIDAMSTSFGFNPDDEHKKLYAAVEAARQKAIITDLIENDEEARKLVTRQVRKHLKAGTSRKKILEYLYLTEEQFEKILKKLKNNGDKA
jgi:hypothetical protein